MRSWIHHARGRTVRQARVGLGDLREEHISRQGFFGPVAMIYREHGPNEIVRVEGSLLPRRVADTTRVEPSDLLYFVHQGTGMFATEFGRIVYEPGDYVLIPKGITFSVIPDKGDSHMLVVETPAPLSLTEHQQVGRHMPVD